MVIHVYVPYPCITWKKHLLCGLILYTVFCEKIIEQFSLLPNWNTVSVTNQGPMLNSPLKFLWYQSCLSWAMFTCPSNLFSVSSKCGSFHIHFVNSGLNVQYASKLSSSEILQFLTIVARLCLNANMFKALRGFLIM